MITIEEAKKAMDEMMAQGTSEDDMLGILYLMFQDDKISLDELEALIDALGYEFSDEFRNMSPEDQKTKGYVMKGETEEGVTDEQIEDAKETQDGEVQTREGEADGSDEEKNRGNENGSEGEDKQSQNEGQENSEKNNKDEKDEEAEERAKARKIYGFKD